MVLAKNYLQIVTQNTSNDKYIKLYKSGYSVFKNYPFFGVGNKNYRVETCKSKFDQQKFDYVCLTHPHQLYLELLSEHGLFGSTIILSIFFYLMFKIFKSIDKLYEARVSRMQNLKKIKARQLVEQNSMKFEIIEKMNKRFCLF